jgi:hypothetical protein
MIRFGVLAISLLGAIALAAQPQNWEAGTKHLFHRFNMDKADDYSGMEVLQTALKGQRVFFSGENHQHVATNGLIEFKLLHFLHSKAGVRHLILELGEARGWYANQFVNQPDTISRYYLQATTSVEHMKILEIIRAWNLSLPSEQRIQIHGVDVERFNDIALLRLSDLLPKSGVPNSLYTAVQAVHQAAGWLKHDGTKEFNTTSRNEKYRAGTPPFSIDRSIDLMVSHFDSLDAELKTWLGKDYVEVQSGINGLREYKQWNQYRSSAFYYTWREEQIYRKLTRLLNSDTTARFFGQFGRCHTAYSIQNGDCGWYAYQSIVHRLNERYFRSNNNVLSIGIFYEGDRDNDVTSNNHALLAQNSETRRLLLEAPTGAISITPLDEKNNPSLAARFGFFIAVRKSPPVQNKPTDKVESLQLSLGLGIYSLNTGGNIISHVNAAKTVQNGYQWPLTMGLQWNNQHFTAAVHLASTLPSELYRVQNLFTINYTFQAATAFWGWRFIKNTKLCMDAGPQILHATEKLTYKPLDGGFLTPAADPAKVVKNHALGIGFLARIQYKIVPYVHLGISSGYQHDLSPKDWFMAKSNRYYAKNLLQTQITGSSFSVFCNFDL